MVGELKKERYVYYHCTGYKGKCPEPYVRAEVLEEKFGELLGRLRFEEDILAWITLALRESHVDEQREHEAAVKRLQAEHDRLRERIHAMYIDKLDGRIDNAFFERMSNDWRNQQDRCLRQIAWYESADRAYFDEGIRLLDLAHKSRDLFAKQEPSEQRRLLNFALSNSI